MLSKDEHNRYNRHILLSEVGESGQEKLKSAKVLVIGAGGLGCPVLQYLTAAGIGTVGIIDFDLVDESNLQRQILYSIDDIGKNKALAAKNRLEKLNPFVNFTIYQERLTTKNALSLFNQYDIVVDGTDNFSTRYLVNDACLITNKPLVYGAIYKFEGQVSVFNYKNGPSYRCLFPEPPKAGSVPSCSEVGVIGVLPGIIGSMQANEVIKIILGLGEVLSEKLTTYNTLKNQSYTLNITRNNTEIEKVILSKDNFENYDYDYFCGMNTENNNISASELKELLKDNTIQVIDVRESWETPQIEELNTINIPMQSLPQRMNEIDKTKKTIIFCQHGVRSLAAIDFLEDAGFDNLINLKGGIVTWEM